MGLPETYPILRREVEHHIRNQLLVWMYRCRSLGMSRWMSRRLFVSIERSFEKARLLR